MEKAGLKTFVCSFVFSLFTVFTINGIYWRASSTSHSEIKIPQKNITLFLRDNAKFVADLNAIPTQKISLSILADVAKKPLPVIDPIPLMAETSVDENFEKIIATAENTSLNSSNDTAHKVKKDKITLEYEAIMHKKALQEQEEFEPPTKQELAEENLSITQEAEPIESGHVYAPLPATGTIKVAQLQPEPAKDIGAPQILMPIVEETKKIVDLETVTVAEAAPKTKLNPLIPLEKDFGASTAVQKGNEVTNKAENNQVALDANNVPIKSMLNSKAVSTKGARNEAVEDAKWQTMEEKSDKSSNPWVVAQGAKFPNNNLVKNDARYQQDEAEIKKVLSANKNDFNSPTIKLASDTVKNLLIPIPEDILKDDNLTPQLISSTKNQNSEEGLAAKELQSAQERKKHEDDLAKEEAEATLANATSTQNPSQSSITNSNGVTKKTGILDSITSIFSGTKTDATTPSNELPEVGDQIGGDNNSLLSAFTRKKPRDNSTMKILPTEIRLSFQPNRAEISGQTLKWIHAFANKTIKDTSAGLEIRIDGTSSPLLQQRRLNLLHNILSSEGVNHNKVRTVFTAREPNSLVIRTIKINNEPEENTRNINNANNDRYMQW